MPPKAVAAMRFVNSKTVSEYISVDNLLVSWGGKDDYEFKFEPEKPHKQMNGMNGYLKINNNNIIQSNEIDGNHVGANNECNGVNNKKVSTFLDNISFHYTI